MELLVLGAGPRTRTCRAPSARPTSCATATTRSCSTSVMGRSRRWLRRSSRARSSRPRSATSIPTTSSISSPLRHYLRYELEPPRRGRVIAPGRSREPPRRPPRRARLDGRRARHGADRRPERARARAVPPRGRARDAHRRELCLPRVAARRVGAGPRLLAATAAWPTTCCRCSNPVTSCCPRPRSGPGSAPEAAHPPGRPGRRPDRQSSGCVRGPAHAHARPIRPCGDGGFGISRVHWRAGDRRRTGRSVPAVASGG